MEDRCTANKARDESPAMDVGADMIASPASDAHKANRYRLRRMRQSRAGYGGEAATLPPASDPCPPGRDSTPPTFTIYST